MSSIIAVLNPKGGVGKTTLAVNLAASLSKLGQRSIVVDMTPQQSALRWAKQARQQQQHVNLSNKFNLSADIHGISFGKGAKRFKLNLNNLLQQKQPNYVLLDCPANQGDENRVAALIAQLVLIPITPSLLDKWSTEATLKIVQDARLIQEQQLPQVLTVINRQQKLQVDLDLASELKNQAMPLADSMISLHSGFIEAVQAGQTMLEYAPRSVAVRELIALAEQLQQITGNI